MRRLIEITVLILSALFLIAGACTTFQTINH